MPNLALQLHATFLVFGVVHAIFSQADTHTHTFQSSFLCHWLENGRTNSSYAACTIRATVAKQKIAGPARFKFQALPVILQVSQQSVHRSWRFQSWSYQPRWSPFSIGAKGRTGGGTTYKQGVYAKNIVKDTRKINKATDLHVFLLLISGPFPCLMTNLASASTSKMPKNFNHLTPQNAFPQVQGSDKSMCHPYGFVVYTCRIEQENQQARKTLPTPFLQIQSSKLTWHAHPTAV